MTDAALTAGRPVSRRLVLGFLGISAVGAVGFGAYGLMGTGPAVLGPSTTTSSFWARTARS